jgi:hypothetical protein
MCAYSNVSPTSTRGSAGAQDAKGCARRSDVETAVIIRKDERAARNDAEGSLRNRASEFARGDIV